LSELPLALTARVYMMLFAGNLTAAASLTSELQAITEATGSGLAPYAALGLAAFRGDEAEASALIDATMEDMTRRGEGIGITFAAWANAVLHNGLGRYDKALAAGRHATAYDKDPASLCWSLVELVEAAARWGATETATIACGQLTALADACRTDWALGAQARSHALLAEGDAAERLYRESITRFGRTRLRVDLARSHLLYGEWLRRERRRGDAREQLRTAHTMLEGMGVAGFAERARRELRATGETAQKRTLAARHEELTAQEAQIARLARDGLSNPEIGTRLFISAHTVQYHLRKVFTKARHHLAQPARPRPAGERALSTAPARHIPRGLGTGVLPYVPTPQGVCEPAGDAWRRRTGIEPASDGQRRSPVLKTGTPTRCVYASAAEHNPTPARRRAAAQRRSPAPAKERHRGDLDLHVDARRRRPLGESTEEAEAGDIGGTRHARAHRRGRVGRGGPSDRMPDRTAGWHRVWPWVHSPTT
jgi:DNA-binding CsgD family transcriptional regulator